MKIDNIFTLLNVPLQKIFKHNWIEIFIEITFSLLPSTNVSQNSGYNSFNNSNNYLTPSLPTNPSTTSTTSSSTSLDMQQQQHQQQQQQHQIQQIQLGKPKRESISLWFFFALMVPKDVLSASNKEPRIVCWSPTSTTIHKPLIRQ